jgi:hypothetical protein
MSTTGTKRTTSTTSKRYIFLERVSVMGKRKDGADDTHTLDDQRKAATSCAAHHGGGIVKTLKMHDESGFTVLAKVMDTITGMIDRGEADGVIVGYSNRLARNWWWSGAFFIAMEEREAEVWDAQTPDLDYRTDEGRLSWGLKSVVNELPSLEAKRKARNVADDVVMKGIANRVPYGMRRNADALGVLTREHWHGKPMNAKALVPDDVFDANGKLVGGTAQVVRRIFRMRLDGVSWYGMVEALTADGIPAPKGGKWMNGTLRGIIMNEVYTGVVILGKRRNETAHEALVTREEWQQAQSNKRVIRNGTLRAGIGGGLCVCSGCGYVLTGHRGDKGRVFYGCQQSKPCERRVYINRDRVDAHIEAVLVALLESDSDVIDLVASAKDIAAAKAAWHTATENRKWWVRFADTLSDEDFRDGYRERENIEKSARSHYDSLVARAGELDDMPTSASAWHALDDERKRHVARQLIDRVVVLPPLSRSKYAPVEDRVEVVFVGGAKLTSAGWQLAS